MISFSRNMKLASIIFISFFILVSYQNCADVSGIDQNKLTDGSSDDASNNDGTIATDPGDDTIICQAIALPKVEIGFLYPNNQDIPQNLEVEINNEIVYSDCNNGLNSFIGQRQEGRFFIFREYEDNAPFVGSIDIRLFSLNCGSQEKIEILSDNAEVNYQPYEVCDTESYKLELDYVMNGE